MRNKTISARSAAFTLIELLVVFAIIAIVSAIIFVVAWKAVDRTRTTACMNKMRQLGMSKFSPEGFALAKDSPDVWRCPQGPQDGLTNYGVNMYLSKRIRHVSDPAAVVLLYESKRAGSYLVGAQFDVDRRHMGGSNFVYVDGHAKWTKAMPRFHP